MKVHIILLAMILTQTLAFQIKLEKKSTHSSSSKTVHNHHSASVSQNINQHSTSVPEGTPKYLQDEQFTTSILIQDKPKSVTLDSTSYLSWLQSNQPFSLDACSGCFAKSSEIFQCNSPCKQINTNDQPSLNVSALGGRFEGHLYLAQEKAVFLNELMKDWEFGQLFRVEPGSTPISTQGLLGLAYGTDYQEYEKLLHSQQLQKPPIDLLKSTELDTIKEVSKNSKKLASEASFNFKLDESLNLLEVGSHTDYFAADEYTEYQNMGNKVWALNVMSFKLGNDEITTSKRSADDTQTQIAQGVIDTTTRFLWVSQYVQNQIITKLSDKNCNTASADTTIVCNCHSIDEFPQLSFAFNGVTTRKVTFNSAVLDYVEHASEGKCSLAIHSFPQNYDSQRLIPDQQNLILFGHMLLKKYYVIFNQKENTINVAKSYPIQASSLYIQPNLQICIVVIGVLLLLASLVVLAGVLKYELFMGIQIIQETRNPS